MTPQYQHSPIALEHRLTVTESKTAELCRKQRSHDKRLSEVESKMITPRDIRMMIAGIMTILGALAGKIPWADALHFWKP